MRSQEDAHLAFDDVRIDFAGHRLWRGGVEQPLEPKAFAVLALLAGAPGRVFARDDILDTVWGHRHVTPGVLNRIMTLLRQALGEDAQHPLRLHTVHGTGYRFDLPSAAENVGLEQERRTLADRRTKAPYATKFSFGGSKWRWPLVAAALALAAWAGFTAWRAAVRPLPESAATARPNAAVAATKPTLVVMPMKPIGDGDGVKVIADGLGEELICSLAQIDGLRVIARESTRLAAAESEDLAQLAQRLGITHALEGNLQQAGQSLRVRLRLTDARGGTLWTRDFDRDASEVLALQREIAAAVAASLALKLGLVATSAKSGDAEFLRRFLAARLLAFDNRRPVDETAEPAENELRALLRERPDDARAHAALAMTLIVRAARRPALATALRADALQEAVVAQRLDPSLAEPYYVQAEDVCIRAEWERCLMQLRDADARGLNPPLAARYRTMVLARLGYLDQAEAQARELIARDPLNDGVYFALARVLDTQGRHEDASAGFQRTDRSSASYGMWFNAVWRRNYAVATELVAAGLNSNDVHASKLLPGYQAVGRALEDPEYWPRAEVVLRQIERDTGLFQLLRVLAPDAPAHAAELITGLDDVRKRGYSTWDLLLWTKDLAYLRRDPAFQNYLRDNGILAYWQRHGFPPQCRPQGDGAACD